MNTRNLTICLLAMAVAVVCGSSLCGQTTNVALPSPDDEFDSDGFPPLMPGSSMMQEKVKLVKQFDRDADGYLLVWADEDGTDTPGLHASFKLSKSGEQIYLTDTDANLNQVLDSISFGSQTTDISYGRSAEDADVWTTMAPTPGMANQ